METFSVLRKDNLRNLEDVCLLELKKSKLINNLGDSHAICNTMKSENHVLITKFKSLEKELNESRNHFRKFSSDKLDNLLKNQKNACDRSGLGFDKYAASSSNPVSSSKIIFVKLENVEETKEGGKLAGAHSSKRRGKEVKAKKKEITTSTSKGKKGKVQPSQHLLPKSNFYPSQRFAQICHHCGKIGHIIPNCFKLKPHDHKRKTCYSRNDFEGLCAMMKNMMIRLDKLDTKPTPLVKKVWVRKDDAIYLLQGNGNGLT